MSFSFGVVNVVGVEVFGDGLSHGGPVEVDPVCVMDDTVEDGVGDRGFAGDVVSFVDGQLAGDQDRGVLVSVLDDFHEVASLIGAEAPGSPSCGTQPTRRPRTVQLKAVLRQIDPDDDNLFHGRPLPHLGVDNSANLAHRDAVGRGPLQRLLFAVSNSLFLALMSLFGF